MGHYWVTINIIHKRRKRVSKRMALRPSLFQYKSSYFVPETKDGLIARLSARVDWLPGTPATFCAFLNEAPSFDAFFLPTRDCYPGESSASVLDWGMYLSLSKELPRPNKLLFWIKNLFQFQRERRKGLLAISGILLLIDSLAIRDRIQPRNSCSLHNLPPRPREEGIRSL